ncbi:TolC family protein [Balneola sp. MJW-20]|uniref:TolC family protein n=1 Tax=Gracilimonas aurantiaca TaxID=3234185 RepID=UPI003466E16C
MVLSIAMVLCTIPVHAQEIPGILYPEEFLEIVKKHHPVAVQADLQPQRGSASVLMARGGFEPKVYTDIARKYFKEQEYYQLIDAGLKIPTWFGMELKAGYEQNTGVFLNPENNTSGGGLWYAGVNIPIGQGLFIDERRAQLRKARLYQSMTEADRQIILNELLLEAGEAYWNWFFAHHANNTYETALQLAEQRLRAVRDGARLGDLPAIDTLEAGIQVQNRQLALEQAKLDLKNAEALLGVYMWAEGIVPLELDSLSVPVTMDYVNQELSDSLMTRSATELISDHPELRNVSFKIEQLRVDRRWKVEQFKPSLNLSFNPLMEADGNPVAGFSPENYKAGLTFSMPILFRKERGGLREADIKIRETELQQLNKRQTLTFKFINSLNELSTSYEQIGLYSQTVLDYQRLLDGERRKFNTGESSLFLVNSRESSYINARIKLIELKSKNNMALLKSLYSLGKLPESKFTTL